MGRPRLGTVLAGIVSCALLLAGVSAPGAEAKVEVLQELSPSPARLTALAADPNSGLLYAQEDRGKSFFVYDARTGHWSELAPAPLFSVNNGGAVYLGGKIYIAYAQDAHELAVYDIAAGTWTTIDNPLERGTGDIATANGAIYLTEGEAFVRFDPVTGTVAQLAEPPKFEEEEGDGFEPWGGLQFDGVGKIYGHQGNGDLGFAVYDLASNSWTELPVVGPNDEEEGGVLGSAFNPFTGTYVTSGGYRGTINLDRFDPEAGIWKTSPLPVENSGDGGMAFVSQPGIEGTYIIEGEGGNHFFRYFEQNQTDLSTSISAVAAGTPTGATITYSIQVKNNGPERAAGVALTESLPGGAQLISATASAGTCAGGATVSCNLGLLRSGQAVDLTVKVTTGFGSVSSTATVTSKAADLNPANDSATATSSIATPTPVPAPGCVVPKLQGLRLKGAKRELRAAHCAPGKVTRHHSAKVKKGRVIRGGASSGASLAVGTKVALTVSAGPKRAPHRHHHRLRH